MSDNTEILLKKSLTGGKLTKAEAEVVISRQIQNTHAIERFEAIERKLDRGKYWIGFLVGGMGGIYGQDFGPAIKAAIISTLQ